MNKKIPKKNNKIVKNNLKTKFQLKMLPMNLLVIYNNLNRLIHNNNSNCLQVSNCSHNNKLPNKNNPTKLYSKTRLNNNLINHKHKINLKMF